MCVYEEPHGATWGNVATWGHMGQYGSCCVMPEQVGLCVGVNVGPHAPLMTVATQLSRHVSRLGVGSWQGRISKRARPQHLLS